MTVDELIELTTADRRYNLHSHTQFCDGRADMATFAEAASRGGFSLYGFSPHSPVPIASPCNMATADVAAYRAEFERLRDRYAPSMRLLIAMEVDYLGPEWGPSTPYFDSLGLDYRIGSVHFLPADDGTLVDIDGRFERFSGYMAEHFHGDIRHVVNLFFDRTEAMLGAGGFEIIGHFDKIAHNGSLYSPGLEDEPWFVSRVNDIIDLIADRGVITEFNTKAYASARRFFPSVRYWRRIKQLGLPVAVNSDTHFPDLIDASRREAFELFDAL